MNIGQHYLSPKFQRSFHFALRTQMSVRDVLRSEHEKTREIFVDKASSTTGEVVFELES